VLFALQAVKPTGRDLVGLISLFLGQVKTAFLNLSQGELREKGLLDEGGQHGWNPLWMWLGAKSCPQMERQLLNRVPLRH
jgi:hypothetical protein